MRSKILYMCGYTQKSDLRHDICVANPFEYTIKGRSHRSWPALRLLLSALTVWANYFVLIVRVSLITSFFACIITAISKSHTTTFAAILFRKSCAFAGRTLGCITMQLYTTLLTIESSSNLTGIGRKYRCLLTWWQCKYSSTCHQC